MYPIVVCAMPEPFSGEPTVTRTDMPALVHMTVEGRWWMIGN